MVQGLVSSGGVFPGSVSSMHVEDTQLFFLQLPAGEVPQSSSITQSTVPVLVEVVVVVVRVEVEVVVDAEVLAPPAASPSRSSVQPPGAAIAAPPSASVKTRPIVRDLRACEARQLRREAMNSP